MRTTSPSTRPRRYRYPINEGIATVKPAAVVISASEIPPASTLGLPTPLAVIAAKTLTMPITVPSKPSNGEIAAIVPSGFR